MLANARSNSSSSDSKPNRSRVSELPVLNNPDDLSSSPYSPIAKRESGVNEEESPETPPKASYQAPNYDREVDILVAKDSSVDPTTVFKQIIPQCDKESTIHPFFALPVSARYRTYSLCFPDEPRKITLSPQFVTGSVFPNEHFASPWVILEDVWGGLASFRALRYELMTYFWTQYRFHITLNPFIGPKFSPLTCLWVSDYLNIIQRLSIEIDLTRLGGSLEPYSSQCRQCERKLKNMLGDILIGLLDRPCGLTISELHLLCRRWCLQSVGRLDQQIKEEDYDEMMGKSITFEDELVQMYIESDSEQSCNSVDLDSLAPRTPEELLRITQMVTEMRGILQRLRLSGFPRLFTSNLFASVFCNQERSLHYIIPTEPAWPPAVSETIVSSSTMSPTTAAANITTEPIIRLSSQLEADMLPNQACSKFTADLMIQLAEVASAPVSPPPNSPVIKDSPHDHLNIELHTSRSFVDEIDEGISKIQESPRISEPNYITTPESAMSIEQFPDLDIGAATVHRIHSYSFLPTSSSLGEAETQSGSMANSHYTTPRLQAIDSEQTAVGDQSRLQSISDLSLKLSPTSRFPLRSSSLRPSPTRCSSPGTINRMNDLNEQDPAFLRTLNAMRSSRERYPSSESTQGLLSMISGTITDSVQTTIQADNSENNPKRRYGGFFSKLRGHKNP